MGAEKEEKVGPVYALYARVSHDDNIQDPQVQLEPMREYCRKKGSAWREYIDLETGRTIEREGYKHAMDEIEEWDTFMVFLPDRLTREGPERGITEVTRILDEGKAFQIFMGGIVIQDRMTAITRMTLRTLFTMAAFESDIISERTRAGLDKQRAAIKEKGFAISKRSGKKIVGLGRSPTVQIKVEDILRLRDEGLSLAEIAAELGSKKSTIHSILKRHFGSP